MAAKQQARVKVLLYSAPLFGRISLLAFVLFIFSGPFSLSEIKLSHSGRLVWDAMLSALFFIQHSGMVRRGLRARMADFIPGYCHGAVFTIASSLVLIVVVLFWQSSGVPLLELQEPLRWLARGVFATAVAGMGWGLGALRGFDPFGTRPIKARLSGKQLREQPFSVQGPYLWVRHPLYFFVLVMIWSCPDLTTDRLLFNLLWSGWIYAGAVLEEKDLRSDFGDDYRRYQKQVPMLIPWKGFRFSRKKQPPFKQGGE